MYLKTWLMTANKSETPVHSSTNNSHWVTKAHLLELSLTNSISVEDDAVRLEPRALVEVDQHLPHHGSELSNDLLAVVLYSDSGRVSAGVSVHTGHQLRRKRYIVYIYIVNTCTCMYKCTCTHSGIHAFITYVHVYSTTARHIHVQCHVTHPEQSVAFPALGGI